MAGKLDGVHLFRELGCRMAVNPIVRAHEQRSLMSEDGKIVGYWHCPACGYMVNVEIRENARYCGKDGHAMKFVPYCEHPIHQHAEGGDIVCPDCGESV